MARQTTAFIIAIYAIGFAFAALAAVRWPSLVAIAGAFTNGASPLAELGALADWRELGIWYGTPYFLSALFFYAASTQVQRRRPGGVASFILGVMTGFPPFLVFDFQPGWWQAPTDFETVVLGASAFTVLLFGFVWELRVSPPEEAPEIVEAPVLAAPVIVRHVAKAKPVRRGPVPAAIAMQRASFAAHGRRQMERRQRGY